MNNAFPHLNKPSLILRAMVDGLKKQSARTGFKVDMYLFGGTNGMVCFGCAATCAAQEASGVDLTVATVGSAYRRASVFKVSVDDLERFEWAVDAARRGLLWLVFQLCDLPYSVANDYKYGSKFKLLNSYWEEQLPAVEDVITDLETDGF